MLTQGADYRLCLLCCSVTKLCLPLCDPMDCSTPGFSVFHSPRVCSNSCPSSQWCYSTISVTLFSSCPQGFPASGLFPVGQHFASGGQSIGVSTSASVLSTNIQDWFLLGLTGLISLPSKVENPQCDLREVVPFRQSLHSGIGSLPLCGLQRGFLTRVSAFKPPPEPLCGHMARMAFL